MSEFRVHSQETAPEKSKSLLQAVEDKFGFVPNLSGILAESPPTLEAYLSLTELFEQSSFTAQEQQVVILAISEYNKCDYCVAAHSMIAEQVGVSGDALAAIRGGEEIDDERLEALRNFTRTVVEQRGWVGEDVVEDFVESGFERRQVLEVILAVALKTIANYSNHIAGTPLDEAFASHEWQPEAA